METAEVTLSICILKNGLPDGLAYILYNNHPNDPYKRYCFEAIGVFKQGKLEGGPFICKSGNGYGLSISNMHDGRPADHSSITYYYKNDCK
jgi:hypothetical protein